MIVAAMKGVLLIIWFQWKGQDEVRQDETFNTFEADGEIF
jgi:hypothetical protein